MPRCAAASSSFHSQFIFRCGICREDHPCSHHAVACRACGVRAARDCVMPYLRRFAPQAAPCLACRAKDPFPDRALVPWEKVRAGASFRVWVDHPEHDNRYLSMAFCLTKRSFGDRGSLLGTTTAAAPTSMRWNARPQAFLSERHGGAWSWVFMDHPHVPSHIYNNGLSVWFDLNPQHVRAWRRRAAALRRRLLLSLRCRRGVPAEVLSQILATFLNIDDFNATPDAAVRLGAVAFRARYYPVELVQVW